MIKINSRKEYDEWLELHVDTGDTIKHPVIFPVYIEAVVTDWVNEHCEYKTYNRYQLTAMLQGMTRK